MLITTSTRQHDCEFESIYGRLFAQLCVFAESSGIGKASGMGATLRAEDPSDFSQECLIEYSRSAKHHEFQGVQVPLIWRIAKQRMIDACRLRNRFPQRKNFDVVRDDLLASMESDSAYPAPTTSPFSMAGLSDKAIDILRLKYVAGYSIDEIARIMQMKPSGVNAAISRARKRLLLINRE